MPNSTQPVAPHDTRRAVKPTANPPWTPPIALSTTPVDYQCLGEVCDIKLGKSFSKQNIADQPGPYPVIGSGRNSLGSTSQFNTTNPLGIAQAGSPGLITWCEGPYFRSNVNFSCTAKPHYHLLPRYLYHLLTEMHPELQALATHDGIPRLNKCNLAKLVIPIPPAELQQTLADELDAITELVAELVAELVDRKAQFQYYRAKVLAEACADKDTTTIPTFALGEICQLKRGQRLAKHDIAANPGPYPVISNAAQAAGQVDQWNTENDPLGIARSGRPGRVTWCEGRYFRGNMNYSCTVRDPHQVAARYLFHLLGDQQLQLKSLAAGTISTISLGPLSKFKVPIPSLAKQTAVVATLDPLHALIHDITRGIPGEIAAREHQLTYCRRQYFAPLLAGRASSSDLTVLRQEVA